MPHSCRTASVGPLDPPSHPNTKPFFLGGASSPKDVPSPCWPPPAWRCFCNGWEGGAEATKPLGAYEKWQGASVQVPNEPATSLPYAARAVQWRGVHRHTASAGGGGCFLCRGRVPSRS